LRITRLTRHRDVTQHPSSRTATGRSGVLAIGTDAARSEGDAHPKVMRGGIYLDADDLTAIIEMPARKPRRDRRRIGAGIGLPRTAHDRGRLNARARIFGAGVPTWTRR
ncbi:MAG: hypothetical protein M5R36_16250, partial [Deltaproteobacteria bacterium]|nr:hypothetical protein [Deltaproteobacteria bacterium]